MTTPHIYRFIPASSNKAPTLLLLHGTGGNEDSLLELGQELLPTANLLSIRGNVLEHGASRFFKRFSEGVFDLEDLALRSRELAAFIRWAQAQHGLLDSPLFAIGYSNGANIAAHMLLTEPSLLQGAILFRAMPTHNPASLPDLQDKSILLISGEHDHLIPQYVAEELSVTLKKCGASLDHLWLPTGHQLTYSDVVHAKQWLEIQTTSY